MIAMTKTTPEQRQRLRELCRKMKGSGARLKWETGCETMAEFANAALPAVPALLSDLDAAEAELSRLRTALAESERDAARLRDYMKAAIRATDHIRDIRGRQLWSRVGWLFGHGSGYATKLCQEFGFDPDEMPPKDSQ